MVGNESVARSKALGADGGGAVDQTSDVHMFVPSTPSDGYTSASKVATISKNPSPVAVARKLPEARLAP